MKGGILGHDQQQTSFIDTVQVLHSRWTLGQVVTAVAESGMRIVSLEEEQGVKSDDAGKLMRLHVIE